MSVVSAVLEHKRVTLTFSMMTPIGSQEIAFVLEEVEEDSAERQRKALAYLHQRLMKLEEFCFGKADK